MLNIIRPAIISAGLFFFPPTSVGGYVGAKKKPATKIAGFFISKNLESN